MALVLVLDQDSDDRGGRGLVDGGPAPGEQEALASPGECLYGGAVGGPSFGRGRTQLAQPRPEGRARGGHGLALFRAWFGFTVLLPLGIVRACAWVVRGMRPDDRSPAESSRGRSRQRGLADAPRIHRRLRRAGSAFVHRWFDRNGPGATQPFPRAALYAFDSGAAPGAGRHHHRALDRYPCRQADVRRVLRDMVNTTNALRADLVLLTGDLIDYELSDLSEGIALVKAMEGRYGLWMIEGNHDLADDGGEFERRVKASGVPFLLDESAVANIRGQPVQFFGLRWMAGNDRGAAR